MQDKLSFKASKSSLLNLNLGTLVDPKNNFTFPGLSSFYQLNFDEVMAFVFVFLLDAMYRFTIGDVIVRTAGFQACPCLQMFEFHLFVADELNPLHNRTLMHSEDKDQSLRCIVDSF